ncbi:hypothetical protein VU01_100416 [Candidatus Electrothrix marina]|uniref:CVNH domain-containing protein n=1 Tax=Candidatus Electrothrix marina TaxID=1859130 RepID=A0A444JHC0_9BACT|nr:hypothetical protein VU01_100416 [Candidatus Electrothrix marina]
MICRKKTAILTLSLATVWSVNALAARPNNGPKPPPEAYTACKGKQPGEKASFTGPMGHAVSGTCEQQGGGRLFLRPDHLGRGNGNGIPPAAYRDCTGKRLGDAVQITGPAGRTISGTCQSDGDRLYLRLDSPPGMNAGMKPHNGDRRPQPDDADFNEEQYREPRNGSRQDDTWKQQAPDQNEDENSYGNQRQSMPPEDMHSNVRQQAPYQNENDSSYGNQQHQNNPPNSVEKPGEQQNQPQQQPVQRPAQKPEEKPKGVLGKMKDFWKKLW